MRIERKTVDLSDYPDLVVVYLGMRVRRPKGLLRILGLGPQVQKSWRQQPDGLLLHEDLLWSLFPLHVGMRQYWRDFDSLETWTRSAPHRDWWKKFIANTGGTGFWHETYHLRGGFEAIYDNLGTGSGLARFAPVVSARGPMFSARTRATSAAAAPAVVSEENIYGDPS